MRYTASRWVAHEHDPLQQHAVEIVSNVGARIQRVSFRQAAANLFHPRQPGALRKLLMLDPGAADSRWVRCHPGPAARRILCGLRIRQDDAAAEHRGYRIGTRYRPELHLSAADRDRVADLLQDLVAKLYDCDQPVIPTPQECTQLLGQVSAIVAVDDMCASPDKVRYLLDVLSGYGLVPRALIRPASSCSDQDDLGTSNCPSDLSGITANSRLDLAFMCLHEKVAQQFASAT